MKLYVLGVGDTFTEKHNTHSLLVEADGFRLAIDCPDSYRRVLRQARDKNGATALDLFGIDDFLVTHVHGDHVNGLEGVGYFKHFAQKKRAGLHTLAAVKEPLWSERLAAPMSRLWNGTDFRSLAFDDYFAWSALSLDAETRIGPFGVRARVTKHHVPTSALLLSHGGRTLGISSDTAFDPSLVEWLAEADLVVHETNYGPAHTAYADLVGCADDVKKKMRLIHYPDEFDVTGSAIPCVLEGDVLEV